jgi:hypothetical protein
MDAPIIMATAAPTAMWFPELIEVVSYTRQEGGGTGVVRKSAIGGAISGALVGNIPGAIIGGVAAAVAANAATPGTHVEFTMVVTIQGMRLERRTRWSACEALAVAMKDHDLPEVKAAAALLPAKYWAISDGPGEDARIQKRAAQLGAFFGSLCEAWRNICAVHGPASPHARLFSQFFELPGHAAGQNAMLTQAPFVTQPAVGTDFGDWRVSGGMLVAMAEPVQAGGGATASA